METKKYVVVARACLFGRSSIEIQCPFCQHISNAYKWSLAGSGKRCENKSCRALFNHHGDATKG